jgi:hypothetical protein
MDAIEEFEQFLNEPPHYEDRRMVRDYRHEAYGKWRIVRAEIERLQAEVVKWQAEAGRFAPGLEAAEALLEEANKEIDRLRASELAWKLIAKQNDRWNKLPQSEKEEALQKALDDTTAELCKLEADLEDR